MFYRLDSHTVFVIQARTKHGITYRVRTRRYVNMWFKVNTPKHDTRVCWRRSESHCDLFPFMKPNSGLLYRLLDCTLSNHLLKLLPIKKAGAHYSELLLTCQKTPDLTDLTLSDYIFNQPIHAKFFTLCKYTLLGKTSQTQNNSLPFQAAKLVCLLTKKRRNI